MYSQSLCGHIRVDVGNPKNIAIPSKSHLYLLTLKVAISICLLNMIE